MENDDNDDARADTRTPEEIDRDDHDLETARDEFKLSYDYTSEQRTKETEDIKFEAGQHWTSEESAWKRDRREPAFTIDQTSGPVSKLSNAPPSRIVVSAVGKGADPTGAQYWQGICRRIENLSNAADVYANAGRHLRVAGRAFWRVRPDYFWSMEKAKDGVYDLTAFEQDIRIESILYQHSVYEDPRCRMLDFSDQRFSILLEDVEWSEFARRWEKARFTSQSALPADTLSKWSGGSGLWANSKSVQVGERYYIEDETFDLCLLKDGTVHLKEDKAPYERNMIQAERTVRIPRVKWMRFTALEVLERQDVPGRYIPVVKVVGERRFIEGKEDNRGIIRGARDPQRLVNFMESRLAKAVDEDSWSTMMAEASTVAEFISEWQNIHIERPALVRYKGTRDVDGKPLDKPELLQSAANVGNIALAATRATMALRAVMGVPDVTPEELRPEQSGVAIEGRRQEQEQTTDHYNRGMDAGIRLTGRIAMSMGREVYSMPRIMRIIGKDEKEVPLVTFKGQGQRPQAEQLAAGQKQPGDDANAQHILDITVGEFDVDVTAGKGYQTGRQEAVESLTNVVRAWPESAPKIVPAILRNSDFPGAQEAAAALEPPKEDGTTVPVEQAQKAQQVIDALTEQLNDLKSGAAEKQAERESKEKIEAAKLETEQALKAAEIEAAAQLEERKFQHEMELAHLEHERELKRVELEHARNMEAMKHGHAHDRAIGAESHERTAAHDVEMAQAAPKGADS